MLRIIIFLSLPALLFPSCRKFDPGLFNVPVENGILVNEGFNRCVSYLDGWTAAADSISGLIPRNLREGRDYWNAWDAAADNYPFMVLTSAILAPEYFKGTALQMLKTEEKLTSRIGSLPDTYSFSKKGFLNETIDTFNVIFGSAEYMKDGLIPLTEWLGPSPWSERMLDILGDLPSVARVVKEHKGSTFGRNAVMEVNGDLLQVLARMYWLTGKHEYLEWGAEIADYYLNEANLPVTNSSHLRIRDHGCEIISGLCEIYLASSFKWPEKRDAWKPYIRLMLDRILEAGRNEDGLFYNEINPVTGGIISEGIADTFGYTLNAVYFVGIIDSIPEYREAVVKALSVLYDKYRNHNWENGGCDGFADAIEGALNLYNREPVEEARKWLDSEIKVMWNYQKPDGTVEGWHGDGNFARTTIMYCLWKTMGILPDRWDEKLIIGASEENGLLRIAISTEKGWEGKLMFETPRYSEKMKMPFDYPRINQFQQWFTPDRQSEYMLRFYPAGVKTKFTGGELINGINVKIAPGEKLFIEVRGRNMRKTHLTSNSG